MNKNSIIKKFRNEAGLTQAELAEKMDVSVVSVQNWESGKTGIEISRYSELAEIFNIPVETLIKETLIEKDKTRQDNWPDFLFDDHTNEIVDTLHLNLAQQNLFGILYIYQADYLEKQEIDFNTFQNDLKRVPYGFIEKVGSIQFMNLADGLQKVIKYVKADYLLKVLKQNPEAEFNIKKLSKSLICEFINDRYKPIDGFSDSFGEDFEGKDNLKFHISMNRAKIILPVLEETGEVHLTNGRWVKAGKDNIPNLLISGIRKIYGLNPDTEVKINSFWKKGCYLEKYDIRNIRNGLEMVTDYINVSRKGEREHWVWKINEKGQELLKWFREK